jgi:hypothetical protein
MVVAGQFSPSIHPPKFVSYITQRSIRFKRETVAWLLSRLPSMCGGYNRSSEAGVIEGGRDGVFDTIIPSPFQRGRMESSKDRCFGDLLPNLLL